MSRASRPTWRPTAVSFVAPLADIEVADRGSRPTRLAWQAKTREVRGDGTRRPRRRLPSKLSGAGWWNGHAPRQAPAADHRARAEACETDGVASPTATSPRS